MSLLFFSDPHLGLERHSHTTAKSRALLQEAVFNQALAVLENPADSRFCLGDLFDKATNSESVLLQGIKVASQCHVLAGNHDSTNRETRKSSMDFLWEGFSQIARTTGNTLILSPRKFLADDVYLIPHCLTQTEFENLLDQAPSALFLCLHCNYDSPFADNEATLNLTRERAEKLLEKFGHILIGHEHNARSDFGGRLQILGCTFPTSFHDCKTDKFLWRYVGGQLVPEKIWDAQVGYREVPWETLLDSPDLSGVQFLSVTGQAPLARMPEIAKRVSDGWGQVPGLLMLRNQVQPEGEAELPETESTRFQDLPSRVRSELPEDLLPVWEHYLSLVRPT